MTAGCTGQLDVRNDAAAVLVGVDAVLVCGVCPGWDDGVLPHAEIRSRRQQVMSRNQGFFD